MSLSKPVKLGRYLGPSRIVQPISKVNWRLLLSKGGDLYLHHLALLSTDQAVDILRKLIEEYETNHSPLLKAVPFLVPIIYTTIISPVHIEDVTQDLPRLVDIDFKHRCHVLTNAVRDSKTLLANADFITSYDRFAVVDEAPGNICARDALLLQLELDKVFLLMFMAASLVLSVILGTVFGVLRHSLDSGFGVGGGILGAIGIVEGIMTWWLK